MFKPYSLSKKVAIIRGFFMSKPLLRVKKLCNSLRTLYSVSINGKILNIMAQQNKKKKLIKLNKRLSMV